MGHRKTKYLSVLSSISTIKISILTNDKNLSYQYKEKTCTTNVLMAAL